MSSPVGLRTSRAPWAAGRRSSLSSVGSLWLPRPPSLELTLPLLVWIVSQDPSNYKDAPVEGVRRVLEIATGDKYPRGEKLKTDKLGAQLSLFCSSCAPPDIALAF